MPYLYRHIRIDKNEPFYVGIGSDEDYERAYCKESRNQYWNNIAKLGYEVEIILDNLTWNQACEKEKEFIKLYGRKDLNEGSLVNMTDGGDGLINPSDEIKNKIAKSVSNSWKLLSDEERLYKNHKSGLKVKEHNYKLTKQQKEINNKKVSDAWNNRSEELKQAYALKKSKQVSDIWKNRSIEEKSKIKEKISNSLKGKSRKDNRKKLQCPHCSKLGISSNMIRYHFNNCKYYHDK